MGKLNGKIAVITGGTSGIGLATAKLFVKEGAYVFITGRRKKELNEAVKEISSNVTGIQGDVAKLSDIDRLYEIVKAKGRIDIIFANAGIGEPTLLKDVNEEHFDRTFNVNVKGALFTVQKALPLLNDDASIILTASVAGAKGNPSYGVYGASKAAVRNFVRSWAVELKDRHIRSNVVSPGPTDTPLLAPQPPDAIARLVSTIPMGRRGRPTKLPKRCYFWPQMTQVSLLAPNYLLMVVAHRFNRGNALRSEKKDDRQRIMIDEAVEGHRSALAPNPDEIASQADMLPAKRCDVAH